MNPSTQTLPSAPSCLERTKLLQREVARIESTLLASAPKIPERVIDLCSFAGVAPDVFGTHDFHATAKMALAQLQAEGGGTLYLTHPHGAFTWIKPTVTYRVCGPLEIPSNTRLLIDHSVRLRFEFAPENYSNNGDGVLTRFEGTTLYGPSPLIRAFAAHDIVIAGAEGHGAMPEITGDGAAWVAWEIASRGPSAPALPVRDANRSALPLDRRRFGAPSPSHLRPALTQFFLCRDVRVENLKFSDAPFWTLHPVFSENIHFRDLLFDCQNVNNDGIDPESSRSVLIERIVFNNHDDNIAIKAGRDREGREGIALGSATKLLPADFTSPYLRDGLLIGSTEDIAIRDCVFKGHYAIAIGSEMSGGVRGVYALQNSAIHPVKNLVMLKSSRARGGFIENVHIHDFRAHRVSGEGITIVPNYDGDTQSAFPPKIRDVHLSEIHARSTKRSLAICGWGDAPIENVSLSDVTFERTDVDEKLDVSGVNKLTLTQVRTGEKLYEGVADYPAKAAPPKRD